MNIKLLEYVHVVARGRHRTGKQVTSYGLTLKGLLASLRKIELEQTYVWQKYKQKLEVLDINSNTIGTLESCVKNQCALLMQYCYENGIDLTRMVNTQRFFNWFFGSIDVICYPSGRIVRYSDIFLKRRADNRMWYNVLDALHRLSGESSVSRARRYLHSKGIKRTQPSKDLMKLGLTPEYSVYRNAWILVREWYRYMTAIQAPNFEEGIFEAEAERAFEEQQDNLPEEEKRYVAMEGSDILAKMGYSFDDVKNYFEW